MQQVWIYILLLIFNLSLFINGKAIHKGPLNETLLVGQINGPVGGATRNLIGMILSMNVFYNNTNLHTSLTPITTSTFPLNYSIALNDKDFKLEHEKEFFIISMIWQPAYIFESNVKLPENAIDTLNFEMRTIKFVIIRGKIDHDTHKDHHLPGKHIKLELIDDKSKSVIDQVDYICRTEKYPCDFEYWLDTSHVKADVEYQLEAIITNRTLPHRKSTHKKHEHRFVETKSDHTTKFKINPTIDTEINDYTIIVSDIQS